MKKEKNLLIASAWIRPSLVARFPEHHSDAMTMIPLLLSLPRYKYPTLGYYYGGSLKEFRAAHSPSSVKPTYWAPVPPRPDKALPPRQKGGEI